MKYFIKRKKLPFSEDDHDFTLTIHLGTVRVDSDSYEAKVQFPVKSYQDGLMHYRQFIRSQKKHLGRRPKKEHRQIDHPSHQRAIALH